MSALQECPESRLGWLPPNEKSTPKLKKLTQVLLNWWVGRIIHHKSDSRPCIFQGTSRGHVPIVAARGSPYLKGWESGVTCGPSAKGPKGRYLQGRSMDISNTSRFFSYQPSQNFDNFVSLTYTNFKPCACVRSLDVSGYFAFPRENKKKKLLLSLTTKPLHIQKKERNPFENLHVASLLLFTQICWNVHVCPSPSGGLSEPAKLVTGIARIRLGL